MMAADDLMAMAREAAANAYAPYSTFSVGAALRLVDGRVVTGANVENASYGLSLCAETVAVAKVANEGRLAEIVEVAVAGSGHAPVTPCGRCRQMLNEAAALGDCDLPISCGSLQGSDVVTHRLSYLLPDAFGPASLASQRKRSTA